ncbi:sn-glycerol-3-phosphate ABC transporter ATP-binding protein UgpC [Metasolibacillus sp. FSL H7-0170]|uniref:ABC transporter ATP-binding protein n=1 Tax=Metasolibacillus TaxID=2703677 RepID=UPI0007913DED|nr:sn-glycerol-3-phosphate ABC transporter ATP-binding protein UgpC [Metasolibacillus fluoroglycofenilyticus]KYG90913.1 sugar ABC transporter ATP-binding protein [[Bacillus] sp. KCTC 13219]
MADLTLKNIYKTYSDGTNAVENFNLEVKDHEFIVLVGPSGCGKSTTLRMIAGLEEISSGDFLIGNDRVNDVEPKDRDIAMVFQNYALYPHMTTYDNMAFGLKLRKMDKAEIRQRVENASEILDLTKYLDKKPKALSGGQRQRVALGRAIVRDAKVFLMDEPLSNLDAKLRMHMRAEIIKLHKRLQTTTIYVTHDQTEALTMASRIVVMKSGRIMQIGTPTEVYEKPQNTFVASFIGSPPMNFLTGVVTNDGLKVDNIMLKASAQSIKTLIDKGYLDKKIIIGIRPEDISKSLEAVQDEKTYKARITVPEMLGSETILYFDLDGHDMIAKLRTAETFNIDDNIFIQINMDNAHYFDEETEQRIF